MPPHKLQITPQNRLFCVPKLSQFDVRIGHIDHTLIFKTPAVCTVQFVTAKHHPPSGRVGFCCLNSKRRGGEAPYVGPFEKRDPFCFREQSNGKAPGSSPSPNKPIFNRRVRPSQGEGVQLLRHHPLDSTMNQSRSQRQVSRWSRQPA